MDMFLTLATEISLKVHGVEMCEDGALPNCLGLSVDMQTHELSFENSLVHTYIDAASLIGAHM